MVQHGVRFGLIVGLALAAASAGAQEAKFKPGDVIEYKVGVAVPEKWERGIIIKMLPGGKQYLIHEKPNQFFPKGSERAYYLADLRLPAAAPNKGADPVANPAPKGGGEAVPFRDGAAGAKGLLSEEDVLAYARKVFGGANREVNEGNMMRSLFSDQIRDYIKKHGTNFKAPAVGSFYDKLTAQGTHSVHIVQAINDNYGPPPKLQDYFGTFWLRTSNRGSGSVKPDGAGVKKLVIEDAQSESGRLTINPNGTYEWELLRGDPPAKWIRGKWRQAKDDEMMPTEGGPAIWLEKAKAGYDYMVRMDREIGYADWINVGVGKGRTPVEYGRRPGGK